MEDTVLIETKSPVATVTLNRPERLNAINADLLRDFSAALREVNRDARVEVIVLRGAGRAFCAGDDLKEFDNQVRSPDKARRFIEDIQAITSLIMHSDKFVVGAIHGWAVGGGFEWVLNCDFTILAEGTRCFLPEAPLGLFVTGAITTLLPNLVGLQKAKELLLFGDHIDASTALELGIVSRVVPADQVFAEAHRMAERIAELPAVARRNVKRVTNQAFRLSLDGAMALETDATVEGFLDPATPRRINATIS